MTPRRLLRHLSLAALLAAAGGCESDDPFTADMKIICAAGGGREGEPEMMRKTAAAKEIASKIKTPEAARLMVRWIQAAPEERAGVVREALAKAGIKRCAFLE